MTLRIALAGNPNSGKTTLFNNLTGSSQKVGNWPGVTIEKKEGVLKGHENIVLIDLPGIYSLSPYSPEEIVSRDVLMNERPDAIINIVDSVSLERSLYLTMQLLDTGIPVVVALNMIDILRARGDWIDLKGLENALGCPVVETSALKRTGSAEVAQKAADAAGSSRVPKRTLSPSLEQTVSEIEDVLRGSVDERDVRWYALKMFERDGTVLKERGDLWAKVCDIVSEAERNGGDDSESMIAGDRYGIIERIVKDNVKKGVNVLRTDRIDRIVMNKWLALPIFASVMTLIFYVAVSLVGLSVADWVNETVFGEWIGPGVEGFLSGASVDGWMIALVCDGIIAGVGAVIGFLPQMAILFVMLAILEDCGYLARIAFLLDKLFRRFGLSGKSIIPELIGTGCSVPAIMAARTIGSESERNVTVLTTPFLPCSAKLPIIALIAGAMFGSAWWMAPVAYFTGITAILISGLILRKVRGFAGKPSPFIMELPLYHAPQAAGVGRQAGRQTWSFIKRAGTVILLASVIIWFLASFDASLTYVEDDVGDSVLAAFGNLIAPLFAPLGWDGWEASVSTLTGIMAKENIVATLGILFGADMDDGTGWGVLAAHFTKLSSFSFLVFNLLCIPCFAAVLTMFRELGWKKAGFGALYMCSFAYAASLIIFQFGSLIAGDADPFWLTVSAAVVIVMVFLIVRPVKEKGTEVRT